MSKFRLSTMFLLLMLLLQACNPEVDVYAPEQELYIVYGILNPDIDTQYVRITKVFQTDSDAIVYAAENDLTARGFNVLIQSDGRTWQGELVDLPTNPDNIFRGTSGIYRFITQGNQAMEVGKRYDLRITKPNDSDFLITAETIIPIRPDLLSPGQPIYSAQNGVFTLPTVEFDEDQLILFNMGGGIGFELRLYVQYFDGPTKKEIMWGPTPVFTDPVRCISNLSTGKMCYEIPKLSIPNRLRYFFNQSIDTTILDDSIRISHNVEGLSRNVWMEVTAIDSFVTDYLSANNPFGYGINLLIDRKEIDNISGKNAGMFGAISTNRKYIFLGSCTRYLAGLPGSKPFGCGE